MPSREAHLEQAEHNQTFLNTVNIDEYPDWAGTVAFYKALHLVEAFLRQSGHRERETAGHSRRNNLLKRRYEEIWAQYGPIYRFSVAGRYRCMPVSAAEVRKEIIGKRLRLVEELVSRKRKRA